MHTKCRRNLSGSGVGKVTKVRLWYLTKYNRRLYAYLRWEKAKLHIDSVLVTF